MPIQSFELLDYFAPVAVGLIFSVSLFLISIAANYFCIRKTDDITQFERLGAKWNLRLGPHRLSVVRKCEEQPAEDDEETA